ncbi:peptide/nickel transport system ATP-binding protein [Thermostichus sp. MS-CIW-19]|jgi:peptide/nickel transport system ATP-binding protein|uniref:ABC transporter ATP-binding protein n=2 Tax=Synechococcus TaxID=1129 RepID=UPI00006945AF|nr:MULTISPECIES: ABC transporter ATP-binding protein [unclassified Synechococcus]ABD00040.1 peptide/opine/nickel ABC transporter (PepT) family, ATP-binding protein [Synechococcus sp. JA-3-3Ab]PIK87054.1 ABC transporter ATP-binding protein [Synechococcus sp. 63AY4M2]PIK87973.1 ABC transporter ATP-binding protein [Synechococcus sp. 65AY6A5]PIK92414.1 ABC transporter ATP-binding protein [Synechococcus sp. 65AY6Li]PIK96123.1 ABC transporter ATP-binding protein [Synechococcus sp. 60AY4M2]
MADVAPVVTSALLTVQGLRVFLPSRTAGSQAECLGSPVVDGLSFQLGAGQVLGLVGESGSGKTITALTLMDLLPSSARVEGTILFQGPQGTVDWLRLDPRQRRRYRGSQIAMIFQEPSTALNPLYTCGQQLRETLRAHTSLPPAELRAQAIRLFEEVQLSPQMLERYPHQLSGGQIQRAAIACAIASNPKLLIADEPTTALDVTVQAEILRLLRDLQQQRQMAILFITHDLNLVAELADQVVVMCRGQAVEQGSVKQIFWDPQHPYTRGLLACRPPLERRLRRLPTVQDFQEKGGSLEERWQQLEIPAAEEEERLRQICSQPPLLQVRELRTHYAVRRGPLGRQVGEIRAVDGISFDLYPGETLGVVGESGCGKTTLGRTLLRLIRASSGQVIYDGEDWLRLPPRRLRRLRREIQLIFQDPAASLDPRMSVGASVMEPMVLHGMGRNAAERRARAQRLFERVGLDPEALDRLPHQFSGGQRQRICIARALASEPRLLVCDEAVSSLDVSVQAQVLNLLKDLQEELGLTYLFISHDLSVVKFMSDRILVMNRGRIEEIGPAAQIYRNPQQDYTRRLIAAIPKGDPKKRARQAG